ncbi:hypothetical protein EJ04DRAFT_554620, partial [Polyplosphaeria fusca]
DDNPSTSPHHLLHLNLNSASATSPPPTHLSPSPLASPPRPIHALLLHHCVSPASLSSSPSRRPICLRALTAARPRLSEPSQHRFTGTRSPRVSFIAAWELSRASGEPGIVGFWSCEPSTPLPPRSRPSAHAQSPAH